MDEGQNSYSETPWMKSDRDDDDDMMESRDGKETPDPVTIPICVLKTEDTTDDESEQAHQASSVQLELNSNVVDSQIKDDMLSSSKMVSSFIPVSCSTCGLILRSHREQMIHIRIHPKECDICGKPYTVMRHLMVHLKTHHSTIPYPCKFCDKGYYVRNELLSHMRCHTAEWQYRCELCMKPFFCSSGLSLHAARSHPGENHQCTICYARFTTKSDLQAHIATHKKALPFKCMFCMSAFGVQNILMRHIRRHPGEPPFTCNRCGVTCADGRESIQHAFSHEVESDSAGESQIVKCEHCNKIFPSKDELVKHSCRTNEGTKSYKCTVCPETFSEPKELENHINKVHHTVRYNPFNPKVQSELIPAREKTIKTSHSVYPSYKCLSCSEEFSMKRDLKHHVKVMHLTKSQSSKSEVTKHIRKAAKESLTSSVEQHLNPMLEQSG
ncbi:zinc finger protein 883 isoform X2 [Anabrus simplex]|uniref:zinc finger protein 883 isoform X2 n=1 Tax=Anabrus simplex TaxID=316456 RepID=UPI0035A346E8